MWSKVLQVPKKLVANVHPTELGMVVLKCSPFSMMLENSCALLVTSRQRASRR